MALTKHFKEAVIQRVQGNPSMDNLAAIFLAVRERLQVSLQAHSVAA